MVSTVTTAPDLHEYVIESEGVKAKPISGKYGRCKWNYIKLHKAIEDNWDVMNQMDA